MPKEGVSASPRILTRSVFRVTLHRRQEGDLSRRKSKFFYFPERKDTQGNKDLGRSRDPSPMGTKQHLLSLSTYFSKTRDQGSETVKGMTGRALEVSMSRVLVEPPGPVTARPLREGRGVDLGEGRPSGETGRPQVVAVGVDGTRSVSGQRNFIGYSRSLGLGPVLEVQCQGERGVTESEGRTVTVREVRSGSDVGRTGPVDGDGQRFRGVTTEEVSGSFVGSGPPVAAGRLGTRTTFARRGRDRLSHRRSVYTDDSRTLCRSH